MPRRWHSGRTGGTLLIPYLKVLRGRRFGEIAAGLLWLFIIANRMPHFFPWAPDRVRGQDVRKRQCSRLTHSILGYMRPSWGRFGLPWVSVCFPQMGGRGAAPARCCFSCLRIQRTASHGTRYSNFFGRMLLPTERAHRCAKRCIACAGCWNRHWSEDAPRRMSRSPESMWGSTSRSLARSMSMRSSRRCGRRANPRPIGAGCCVPDSPGTTGTSL